MSDALVWHLIRDNNSFLVKRNRTNRCGAVQFSSEPGNVLNVNTFKYSGIANSKTIDIASDLTLKTKDEKISNLPAKSVSSQQLTLGAKKSISKISDLASYRGDLASAAKSRYLRSASVLAIKKGYSKKVVKSTRRNSKK
eukprot:CAMPEP_0201091872 /NCGR_PEP_ID=MMETSP0812-20130820/376_1 /ASSEMBLY_ACC=CAM_ASM_000668 /TAXON_ID=98059 /ORGANISM="Dinobryon sp., Strain UTEXLB2267" /LENGTH=139 /DNA_ID=CAMNT_0047343071 /DNA_START=30 /DNA_END=449 /DNA_ORIENTATION=+